MIEVKSLQRRELQNRFERGTSGAYEFALCAPGELSRRSLEVRVRNTARVYAAIRQKVTEAAGQIGEHAAKLNESDWRGTVVLVITRETPNFTLAPVTCCRALTAACEFAAQRNPNARLQTGVFIVGQSARPVIWIGDGNDGQH